MTAGFVLTGRIWEFTDIDDIIGGNTPTGTVVYEGVQARLENVPTSLTKVIPHALSLEGQGYETTKNFSIMIHPRPGMSIIEKKHYFQIMSPPNSVHYLKMFRITYVLDSDYHPADPRRFLVLVLEQSKIGHGNNYQ